MSYLESESLQHCNSLAESNTSSTTCGCKGAENCLLLHKANSNALLYVMFRAKGQLIYWVCRVLSFKKVNLSLTRGLEQAVFQQQRWNKATQAATRFKRI